MLKHIELENELRRRAKKRRMIELAICAVLLMVTVVFAALYEQSKVVEEIGFGPIKHQSVTYNTDYVWGIMAGVVPLIPLVVVVICDFAFAEIYTVEVGGDFVTLHRGLTNTGLYINGEQRDELAWSGYHLEAALSDGSKVNVALGKWSAYITFSNGHPPVEL